jgi:hypothetical protein
MRAGVGLASTAMANKQMRETRAKENCMVLVVIGTLVNSWCW